MKWYYYYEIVPFEEKNQYFNACVLDVSKWNTKHNIIWYWYVYKTYVWRKRKKKQNETLWNSLTLAGCRSDWLKSANVDILCYKFLPQKPYSWPYRFFIKYHKTHWILLFFPCDGKLGCHRCFLVENLSSLNNRVRKAQNKRPL